MEAASSGCQKQDEDPARLGSDLNCLDVEIGTGFAMVLYGLYRFWLRFVVGFCQLFGLEVRLWLFVIVFSTEQMLLRTENILSRLASKVFDLKTHRPLPSDAQATSQPSSPDLLRPKPRNGRTQNR